VRQPFSKRIDRMLARHRRTMSAAVTKLSDNQAVVRNPHVSAYTASIIKVAILIAAEQRDRRQGHGLTSAQRATARPMIEASDNDAATALWQEAGKGRALFRLFRQLRMSHTSRAPTLFEPWDGVMTTATDQVQLLQSLARGAHGVTDGDRQFVLHLMRHVEPDQDWGVPAGTKRGWSVAVKNGWVPIGSRGWTVNTIGIVGVPHRPDYALAIVTTGSSSEAAGIKKVDAIARSVARRWG
jgi:beta-lactamase class A